jgi:hypothetical protein
LRFSPSGMADPSPCATKVETRIGGCYQEEARRVNNFREQMMSAVFVSSLPRPIFATPCSAFSICQLQREQEEEERRREAALNFDEGFVYICGR